MDAPHKYTVEEVLEIALALKPDERKLLQAEIEKSLFSEQEVLNRITPYHKKYEATYTLLKN